MLRTTIIKTLFLNTGTYGKLICKIPEPRIFVLKGHLPCDQRNDQQDHIYKGEVHTHHQSPKPLPLEEIQK